MGEERGGGREEVAMITVESTLGEWVYDIYLCQSPSPKRTMHEHGEERVLEACRGPFLYVPRSWWHAGRAATTYHSTNKRASSVEIDLGLDNGQDGRGALAPALIALGPVGSEGLEGWRDPRTVLRRRLDLGRRGHNLCTVTS